MKVSACGSTARLEELESALPDSIDLNIIETVKASAIRNSDLIFDLYADEQPERLKDYYTDTNATIILSSVKNTLLEMTSSISAKDKAHFIGMNCLPTFIHRSVKEFSTIDDQSNKILEELGTALNWDYEIVEDRCGMVSPRVIFMIINEAYNTLQEGTAEKAAIDKAMKLGTNYPMGPFEWSEKIGLNNIVETLEAIFNETMDERYKIAPLLRKESIIYR